MTQGSSLVICRQSELGLDAWKEVLRLTLKELEGVRIRNKKDEHFQFARSQTMFETSFVI